jgi:hypothetical protein
VFRDREGIERRGSVVDVYLAAHAQPQMAVSIED